MAESREKSERDCPKCGGTRFGDVPGNCPLSADYVASKPWPKTTINDGARLIRKIGECSSISAKLILLRDFAQNEREAGRRDALEEQWISVEEKPQRAGDYLCARATAEGLANDIFIVGMKFYSPESGWRGGKGITHWCEIVPPKATEE